MTLQELFDNPMHHEKIGTILLRKMSRLKYRRDAIDRYIKENKLDVRFKMSELRQLLYKFQGYKKETK